MMLDDDYTPADYWSGRLSEVGGLRSTGHVSYGEAYNRWLYRRKGIVLQHALRRVDGIGRALDLGSGVGWVVDQLQRAGASDIHGVDISAGAVAALRARFPSFAFDQVRLGEEPLPRGDESVDVATFLDVAYHIVDDDLWAGTVREVGRVVRRGGGLVVIDAFARDEQRPAPHVRFRAADRWHEVAGDAGFVPIATMPCYRWLSRPRNASRLRRLPETVRGAIELGMDAIKSTPSHLACVVYERRG